MDSPQVFHRLIRADHAVTATVERPGAAEGTIPWTAARKFNGGAWVEDTDEIFFAMAQQITRGADGVEGLDKTRGRSRSERRYHTGHAGNRRPIMLDSLQELRNDGLSLAFEYAIDCALAMFQKAIRNK